MEMMTRPWGRWTVLDKGQGYKVKRLEIDPGQSISYQYHNHRDEFWTIVAGSGIMLLDDEESHITPGMNFVIYSKEKHKVTNTSETVLVAIEVQLGEITEEDDIVRV